MPAKPSIFQLEDDVEEIRERIVKMQASADWLQKRLGALWQSQGDDVDICKLALQDVQGLDNNCRVIREQLRLYRSALSKYQRSAQKARLSKAARQRVAQIIDRTD